MEKNEFSLLQELTREKLEVWLKNIENLAILLPKNCDISELAIVFHDFFELNKRFFNNNTYNILYTNIYTLNIYLYIH